MWKNNLLNTSSNNNQTQQRSFIFIGKLFRTKEPALEFELDKKKQLNTSDLCSLGVGSCIGSGVYLVSGLVIRNFAGPAAIISFILAAIASLLSGVCYAEFGVRIPQCTGTAYQYSYASVGELIAFLIGWNLILEYMIGTAAGACAISASIDSLFSGTLSSFSNSLLGLTNHNKDNYHVKTTNKFESLAFQHTNWQLNNQSVLNSLKRYSIFFDSTTYKPDFMAAFFCLLMTLVLISGVKKSTKINNYFNMFNAFVLVFLILAAIPLLDTKYWQADYYNSNSKASIQNINNFNKFSKYDKQTGTLNKIPYQKNISYLKEHIIKKKDIFFQVKQKSNHIKQSRTKRDSNSEFENEPIVRSTTSSSLNLTESTLSSTTITSTTSTTSTGLTTSTIPTTSNILTTSITSKIQTYTKVYSENISNATNREQEYEEIWTNNSNSQTFLTTVASSESELKIGHKNKKEDEKVKIEENDIKKSLNKNENEYEYEYVDEDKDENEKEKETILITEKSYERHSTTKEPFLEKALTNKTNDKEMDKKEKNQKYEKNQKLKSKQKMETKIENGFLPFGWQGVFQGAATCFYGYIGFDIIASTGSSTQTPTRSIPIAMISATLITLIIYVVVTLLITLTMPTNLVVPSTALVNVFDFNEMDFVKSIAALGALTSLTVAMFGSMFPMPRVIAAMAKDGLIWGKLAEINCYTGTTVFGIVFLGVCTSIIALIFPLQVLVEMMSIGTLMAYTIVSICVLMLRYQPTRTKDQENQKNTNNSLIGCFPEQYRNAIMSQEQIYQQTSLNNDLKNMNCNQNQLKQQQQQQQQTQQITKNKVYLSNKKQCAINRINRVSFNSSEESEEFDFHNSIISNKQNVQRVLSKDDDDEDEDEEYLVENENNFNYGSVPYQYGGSSGKREFMFPFLEKFIVYWFPYGWKVPGPATEETSFFVMKLIGIYFILVVLIDMILAFITLTIERHLLLIFFIFLILCLIITLFTIARQPQTKLDLRFKAPGLPYVPAFGILINIYLIFHLSYLTLIRFTIWIILGFLIYFLYGIKNSFLEKLGTLNETQFNQSNNNQSYLNSTQISYNQNLNSFIEQDQQIELTNCKKVEINPFLNNYQMESSSTQNDDYKYDSNYYSNKNPFLDQDYVHTREHEFNFQQ